ncbi:hypothetical protein FGU46_03230 [Methanobacterium sp. CWC-01]|uniref:hypothetical protein n=1 Tax=Methanobacterium aridiramus TaxID=2584467 RepID=UPI002578CBE1|nr:hypothetical protein [Methanobacterium sp. CWC-01]WJI09172.1 hypothetical protein FGU46_03230 [Methanobacterium sp. CWC-01]
MLDKRQIDILTTVGLVVFGIIAYFLAAITGILPPEYATALVLIVGVISQLTSEARVREATETFKKWIYFDRLTTILLMAWPIVLIFQDTIMGAIPVAYVGAGSFIFAVISQYVADKREEKSEPVVDAPTQYIEPQ